LYYQCDQAKRKGKEERRLEGWDEGKGFRLKNLEQPPKKIYMN